MEIYDAYAQDVEDTCVLRSKKNGDLPLFHVDTKVECTNNLAQITLTQYYFNKEEEETEFELAHPVDKNVTFTGFEVQVGKKTLKTQVRENKEVEVIYEDAVASGKTAATANFTRRHRDLVRFQIGALKPSVPIVVRSTFNQVLQVEDMSWRLFVPNTIMPRYISELPEVYSGSDPAQEFAEMEEAVRAYYTRRDFKQSFQLGIKSNTKLERVVSLSHDVKVDFDGENSCSVELADPEQIYDSSLTVLFKSQTDNEPQAVVE